jgi:phosphate:Na+ symporter
MTLLTEGLKALEGPSIRRLLHSVTARPTRAFGAGLMMTVATQASSATVLATIGFITSGMMSIAAAIPLVAGATVGTSSTTWLVATLGLSTGIAAVLMPLLALGAVLRTLGRGRWRHIGTAIAGITVLH